MQYRTKYFKVLFEIQNFTKRKTRKPFQYITCMSKSAKVICIYQYTLPFFVKIRFVVNENMKWKNWHTCTFNLWVYISSVGPTSAYSGNLVIGFLKISCLYSTPPLPFSNIDRNFLFACLTLMETIYACLIWKSEKLHIFLSSGF